MSYSFNFRAATKALAVTLLASKFAEVVQAQPLHAKDQEVAIQAATQVINLLPDNVAGRELSVAVNGALSGAWDGAELKELYGVNVSVGAYWAEPAPQTNG